MYNANIKWLEIAIHSLQAQYYTNWELYIQDDCSIDTRCCKFIKSVASKDSRIKLEISEKNQGISKTSNRAIERSDNEYFLLMDQDDEMTPDS